MNFLRNVAMAPVWLIIGIMALPFAVLKGITTLMERFDSDAKARSDAFLAYTITVPGGLSWIFAGSMIALDRDFGIWIGLAAGVPLFAVGLYVASVFGVAEDRLHERFRKWSKKRRDRLLAAILILNAPLFLTVLGAFIPYRD